MEKINFQDLPSTETPINASNLNKMQDNMEAGIEEVKTSSSMKMLWRNSNPTSQFGAQNITLSDSDYDMLTVLCKRNTSDNAILSCTTLKGHGFKVTDTCYKSGTNNFDVARYVTYVDDTTYQVSQAQQCIQGASSIATVEDRLIPVCIIGYKLAD